MYVVKDKNEKIKCPIEKTLDIIGGKWKPVILWALVENETMRYGKLKKYVSGITDKMLSQQLKSLEDYKLINRKQYDEIPPRVEYSLSENGKTLIPLLEEMCKWGNDLMENKKDFD